MVWDLPYPVVRHVSEGVCKELNLERLGGRDYLPEMIEIARLTQGGATLHHAAKEVAHTSQTNARDRYAMQERLRKSFTDHEQLYRMIAASADVEVTIDGMVVELERWSIQELDFAAVLQDMIREHGLDTPKKFVGI
jgi:hypothetical protein